MCECDAVLVVIRGLLYRYVTTLDHHHRFQSVGGSDGDDNDADEV